MESKNVLLVVICVCAFLVIVFGVALWFTLPKNEQASASINSGSKRNSEISLDKNSEKTPAVVEQNNTTTQTNETNLVLGQQSDGTAPETTAEPIVTGTDNLLKKDKQPESDIVTLRIPLKDKPENTKTVTKKYVPTAEKKKVENTEKKPQPTQAPKKQIAKNFEYWIQAGSYRSKNLADAQSAKLTDHGFSSQLITREVEGKLYYRVRIGPYTNNAEAQKFLSWIKVLDGMEESYISQLYAQRTLN